MLPPPLELAKTGPAPPIARIITRSAARHPRPACPARSRPPLPAEFRPPAESPRDRGKALLEDAARSGLGAEMVDEDDLAARLGHARKLVERRLRVGHRGDDVLRDHRVEEGVGEAEMLRIHHR